MIPDIVSDVSAEVVEVVEPGTEEEDISWGLLIVNST